MILCLKNAPKEVIACLKKHGYKLDKAGRSQNLFVIDKAGKYGRDLAIADIEYVGQEYLGRLTELKETKTIINCFFQYQMQSIEWVEYCINETKQVIDLIEQNFKIEKKYKEYNDYLKSLKKS